MCTLLKAVMPFSLSIVTGSYFCVPNIMPTLSFAVSTYHLLLLSFYIKITNYLWYCIVCWILARWWSIVSRSGDHTLSVAGSTPFVEGFLVVGMVLLE